MTRDTAARQRTIARLREAGVAAALIEYADKHGYGRDSAMWEFADLLGFAAEALRDIPEQTKAEGQEVVTAIQAIKESTVQANQKLADAMAATTRTILVEHRQTLEANTRNLSAQTENTLIQMVQETVKATSEVEARSRLWRGLAWGLGVSLVFGACFFIIGRSYGRMEYVAEIEQMRDSIQFASNLERLGELRKLATCSVPQWRKESDQSGRTWCVMDDKSGNRTGWRIK